MKTKQLLFTAITLVFLSSATVVAENQQRNVSSFSAISLNISGTVFLEQGSPQNVQVEASESTLKDLITEVKNGTLIIRFKNKSIFWPSFNKGKVEIYITVPDIEALTVSGSGNIECKPIKARNIELTVSGSGDIMVRNLVSENIKSVVSGSGNIRLDGGSADEFTSTVTGSGNIKAADLEAANARVTITGSGNCSLTVSESLKARVTGSGGISYKGSPQLDTNVTGSGRIKRL